MSSEVIFLGELSHITDLKAEMTSGTQNLNAKQQKSLKSLKKSIPRSQVVRINGDDELKNIAGRIPETTRIVVQTNLYPNLDKIRKSKKNTRINKNSRPI